MPVHISRRSSVMHQLLTCEIQATTSFINDCINIVRRERYRGAVQHQRPRERTRAQFPAARLEAEPSAFLTTFGRARIVSVTVGRSESMIWPQQRPRMTVLSPHVKRADRVCKRYVDHASVSLHPKTQSVFEDKDSHGTAELRYCKRCGCQTWSTTGCAKQPVLRSRHGLQRLILIAPSTILQKWCFCAFSVL